MRSHLLPIYLLLTLLLFVFLQITCSYDFLYAEQFRLFRFSSEYAVPFLTYAGGPVAYLSSFVLQFFAFPYAGAAITSLMFFLVAYGTDVLLKGIAPKFPLPMFGVLIGLMTTALATESLYSPEQTWAFIFTIWTLALLVRIRKIPYLWTLLLVTLLYYIVGLMAVAAVVVMVVLTVGKKQWKTLAASLAALAVIAICQHHFTNADMSHTWTLDAYYSSFLHAPQHSYFPVGILLLGVLTALFLSKVEVGRRKMLSIILQIVIAILLGGWYFSLCHTKGSVRVKKLELWRWNGEWQKILAEDMPVGNTPLYANYQNLALAAEGKLGDELLERPQCGPTGLQQVWQGMQYESDLLSDVFLQQGHVAMAQKMAFTAVQSNRGMAHGRLMLRLIETNLILGADKVAEKYIKILEQTLCYADKARAYRKYLGHPELVSQDRRLGELQRCTRGCDWCPNDFEQGLQMIVEANPSYRNAFHYLGAFYLLNHNMEGFKAFLDKYRDYPGMKPLPAAFRKIDETYLNTKQ